MTPPPNTSFPRLKKLWDVELTIAPDDRAQFLNLFTGALSALVDDDVWNSALETASNDLLRYLKAKKKD